MKPPPYSPQKAETLALQAITFLAGDDERISRFMAVSGMDRDGLIQATADKTVLAGIMDYILSDDSLLIEFAEGAGISPEEAMLARSHLPGFSPI